MAAPDDGKLVQRTLAGDLSAFETLVQRHRAVVHRVATRIVGATDADDVTQDTFLRAFHRLGQFRGESPFLPWLLRVANSVALNTLERRRPEPTSTPEVEEDSTPGSTRTPAEALEERERRERLTTKLRLIQPAHRTVLVLRDLEGTELRGDRARHRQPARKREGPPVPGPAGTDRDPAAQHLRLGATR